MVFEKKLKKKNESKDNSTCYYNIRVVLWNTPIIFEYYSPERKKKKKLIENISAAVCMCFHARVGHLKSLIAFF